MATGMKYPKDLPSSVSIKIGKEVRVVTDVLSDLSITPYFGFWGIDEILKTNLGCGSQLAVVRTIESYPTLLEAKAYIEGFMSGRKNRIKRK